VFTLLAVVDYLKPQQQKMNSSSSTPL
jgi:hypothetical protein